MAYCIKVRDDKERASFKEHNLICIYSLAENCQALFQLGLVWQQNTNDLGPGLIKSLIPDTSLEALSFLSEIWLRNFHYFILLFIELDFSFIFS